MGLSTALLEPAQTPDAAHAACALADVVRD